jgi:hypothetical protein
MISHRCQVSQDPRQLAQLPEYDDSGTSAWPPITRELAALFPFLSARGVSYTAHLHSYAGAVHQPDTRQAVLL